MVTFKIIRIYSHIAQEKIKIKRLKDKNTGLKKIASLANVFHAKNHFYEISLTAFEFICVCFTDSLKAVKRSLEFLCSEAEVDLLPKRTEWCNYISNAWCRSLTKKFVVPDRVIHIATV